LKKVRPARAQTSEWRHFDYEERDGVATLTFSRPERLNSLTFEVYADIRDLTEQLRSRGDEVRVLVIRGRGRGFCSGGDVDEIIAELLKMGTRDVYEFARMTGACVRNLREMPQPVIAAVNGVAAGAGAVLAAASDIRVLAESATFRFLFTSVGLSGGDMGICWLLPRIIGFGRATEALLLGGKITSQDALAWGLASRVVADDQLDAAVAEYTQRLQDLAPWGLAMTKEMLNRDASTDYSSAIEMEAFTQTMLMTGEDFREFHAGFSGKRKPKFRGR
jgi:enoyl-CoA hydratase/carnithine racemase